LNLFNKLRKEPIRINPSYNYSVDKSLINTRNDFDFNIPSYDDMICGIGKWIMNHNELYPQYDIKEVLA